MNFFVVIAVCNFLIISLSDTEPGSSPVIIWGMKRPWENLRMRFNGCICQDLLK